MQCLAALGTHDRLQMPIIVFSSTSGRTSYHRFRSLGSKEATFALAQSRRLASPLLIPSLPPSAHESAHANGQKLIAVKGGLTLLRQRAHQPTLQPPICTHSSGSWSSSSGPLSLSLCARSYFDGRGLHMRDASGAADHYRVTLLESRGRGAM